MRITQAAGDPERNATNRAQAARLTWECMAVSIALRRLTGLGVACVGTLWLVLVASWTCPQVPCAGKLAVRAWAVSRGFAGEQAGECAGRQGGGAGERVRRVCL